MRKIITFLLRFSVTAVLLYLLFKRTPLGEFFSMVKSMKISFWFACVILYTGVQSLSALRWWILIKAKGINYTLFRTMSLYFMGMFFNIILPTGIGGDFIKGWELTQASGRGAASFASIITERLTGFLILVLIGFFSSLLGLRIIDEPVVFYVISASLLILLGAGIITFKKPAFFKMYVKSFLPKVWQIDEKLQRTYEEVADYKRHPAAIMWSFLLSFPIQIANIFMVMLVARGLGINISFVYFFIFIPAVIILSILLPISISGLGVREWLCVYLFGKIALLQVDALSMSLIWFSVMVATSLFGGIVFLFRDQIIKVKRG